MQAAYTTRTNKYMPLGVRDATPLEGIVHSSEYKNYITRYL